MIVQQMMVDEQTVFLYDNCHHEKIEIFMVSGQYIIFSSMKELDFEEFERQFCPTIFIMPVWTEDELQHVPNDRGTGIDIHARFERFGGIPQQIFAEDERITRYETQQDLALCKNFPAILTNILRGSISTYDQRSSFIIHAHSDPPHREYEMNISSKYIEERIMEERESVSLAASVQYLKVVLLSDVRNLMQLGTFNGTVFESVVHKIIRNDHRVDLPTRVLDENGTVEHGQLEIRCNDHETVPEMTNMLHEMVYYRPKKRNHASFDSVLVKGNVAHLFQITVNPKRGFNPSEINNLNKLPLFQDKELKFYFVAPPTIAVFYKRWHNPSGNSKLLVNVKQYVAVFDLKKISSPR